MSLPPLPPPPLPLPDDSLNISFACCHIFVHEKVNNLTGLCLLVDKRYNICINHYHHKSVMSKLNEVGLTFVLIFSKHLLLFFLL